MTHYVRFRQSAYGWAFQAPSAKAAREAVARDQGTFAMSYIKVSRKPEPGIVYCLELAPQFLPANRS